MESTLSTLTATIPASDPVPVAGPLWLFWVLLLLTFLVHLLAMNFVLGGTIILTASRWRARKRTDPAISEAIRLSTKWLPVMVAAAVTFGVAPLLFVQVLYGRLLYSSSILMGWYWWSVIPLLILSYYGIYWLAFKEKTGRSLALVISLSSALGFLAISLIYSNNMSLMLRPEVHLGLYLANPGGTSSNFGDPTLIPRHLHMLLGALAVAGMGLAVLGLALKKRLPESAAWLSRTGGVWFLFCTVVNFLVGTWFLLSFEWPVLKSFMSQGMLGVLALLVGIILAVVGLGFAFIEYQNRTAGSKTVIAAAILVAVMASMVLVRDGIRQASLDQVYSMNSWIMPQWPAILLFVFLLVGALVTIVWMVARFAREHPAKSF